jgi:hypothetical protein
MFQAMRQEIFQSPFRQVSGSTPRLTRRAAPFPHVFFAIVALTALCFSQFAESQSPQPSARQAKSPEAEKDQLTRRQAALAMLDLVLAGAKSLSLPQNRLAIESEAFPLLWNRNESQARALVTEMVGDFAQAASRQQETSDPNSGPSLRQQWQVVLRTIAQSDAELALSFMNASRLSVQSGNPEQDEVEERRLRLELAAQQAAHDPRNALRAAEKDLQTPGDLPWELINLLAQVAAKDPEAGTQLLHDIVARVRSTDVSSPNGNFNFALNLLNSQAPTSNSGTTPDDTLKTLADSIASTALSPQFPAPMLRTLQASLPALEQFAPSRAQALHQKLAEQFQALTPEQKSWDQFSDAQASGDPNRLLAAVEQSPEDVRSNISQQVAWQFANNGDLPRARQVAESLTDPLQREQVMQQALRQSAWNACNQGDFAAARQLAQQITPEEDRATMLAQFALNAVGAQQEAIAQEMLEEASGLLASRAPGASLFTAQLQVAQAFARLKPARAVPLLERSASQLQQVLAAAAEVDAFLPFQRSFEGGELILNSGFLFNSLIQPYVQATAELANYDLPAARILADRLPLPEARLMAELSVARTALGDPTPAAAQVSIDGNVVGLRQLISLR